MRAYLEIYRDRPQEAQRLAHRAVCRFLRRGDSHGAGRALLTRSVARKHCGDRDGAYADYCEALSRIPHHDEYYFATALQNLATFARRKLCVRWPPNPLKPRHSLSPPAAQASQDGRQMPRLLRRTKRFGEDVAQR